MSRTVIDDGMCDFCWKVRNLYKLREPLYMLQQSFILDTSSTSEDATSGQKGHNIEEADVSQEDIWLVINSNCRFAAKTLPKLIDSLLEAGWHAQSIRVGIGGDCEALPPGEWMTQLEKGGGAVHYTGPQDVMDFNGMAAAMRMEELERRRFLFYMHDTMEVYTLGIT